MNTRKKPNTKKTRMYDKIRQHGENLKEIFGLSGDPVALSKKVFMLEGKAHRAAEQYANGYIDTAQYSKVAEGILKSLDKVIHFNKTRVGVFVNSDPRGYALKIDYQDARGLNIFRDMGGYGILAPDFRE